MGKTEETVIEMDIEELKEYLKSHPDIVRNITKNMHSVRRTITEMWMIRYPSDICNFMHKCISYDGFNKEE